MQAFYTVYKESSVSNFPVISYHRS